MQMPIQLLFSSPVEFAILALSLIVSITIHEFSHAYAATKLGDLTAKSMGRLTLNPKAHLDPVGTLMLLFAGFGWGKPVPFNPYYLKNPKRDAAIISFAGPASNFILAIIITLVIKFLPFGLIIDGILIWLVIYNLLLGFFNLIPIHPLDGFKVVNGFLNEDLSVQWMQMAPYGIYILLFLIFTRTLGSIVSPLITFALNFLGLLN